MRKTQIKMADVMPLLLLVSGSTALYRPIRVSFGMFSLTLKVMLGAENSGPSSTLRTLTFTGTEFQPALVPLSSASLRAMISSATVSDFS